VLNKDSLNSILEPYLLHILICLYFENLIPYTTQFNVYVAVKTLNDFVTPFFFKIDYEGFCPTLRKFELCLFKVTSKRKTF
jgi:hypothetical protein